MQQFVGKCGTQMTTMYRGNRTSDDLDARCLQVNFPDDLFLTLERTESVMLEGSWEI